MELGCDEHKAQKTKCNCRHHTFMRRARGWPMPPAAPRIVTFLSGVVPVLYARSEARSAAWDAAKRFLIVALL